MRKIFGVIFSLFILTSNSNAQFLRPPRQQIIKDSVPQHPHPDSMYAKVTVIIHVSPFTETTYNTDKIICDNCDSSRIKYIRSESEKIARQQKGLKTMKADNGLETGVDYKLPVLFLLPRYGQYPK